MNRFAKIENDIEYIQDKEMKVRMKNLTRKMKRVSKMIDKILKLDETKLQKILSTYRYNGNGRS